MTGQARTTMLASPLGRKTALLWAIALLVSLPLASCTMDGKDPYLTTDYSKYTPIRERGAFEDAKTELDAMLNEIAAAFTKEFPDCPMAPLEDSHYSLQPGTEGEFGQSGFKYHSILWYAHCSVSTTQDRSDRALALVTAITNAHGFDGPSVFNNRIATADMHGSLTLVGANADGDSYNFGSANYTVLTYTTAPRYTAKQLAGLEANPDAPVIDDRPTVP